MYNGCLLLIPTTRNMNMMQCSLRLLNLQKHILYVMKRNSIFPTQIDSSKAGTKSEYRIVVHILWLKCSFRNGIEEMKLFFFVFYALWVRHVQMRMKVSASKKWVGDRSWKMRRLKLHLVSRSLQTVPKTSRRLIIFLKTVSRLPELSVIYLFDISLVSSWMPEFMWNSERKRFH